MAKNISRTVPLNVLIFLILSIFYSPDITFSDDICHNPELISRVKTIHSADIESSGSKFINATSATNKFWCQAKPILYRSPSGTKQIEYAIIRSKRIKNDDMFFQSYIYFLHLPDGKIIPLDSFSPAKGLPLNIFSELGYDRTSAGDLNGADESVFHQEKYLEIDDQRVCLVFRMKDPFIGEMKYCNDSRDFQGKAAYAPGTVTIDEAKERVCSLAAQELSLTCANSMVEISKFAPRRSPDDRLYYLIESRGRLRSHPSLTYSEGSVTHVPVEYDVRTYRVNAIGGETTIIKHTPSSFCGSHECADE